MDNLVWVSQSEMPGVLTQGCDDNSSYPPAFTSYLSRQAVPGERPVGRGQDAGKSGHFRTPFFRFPACCCFEAPARGRLVFALEGRRSGT
ncbi:unnamed protein product, partial [Prorocentrum cordatum]